MKKIFLGLILSCSVTAVNAAELSERMGARSGDWGGLYVGGTFGYGLITDFNGFISDRGEGAVFSFFGGYNVQVTDNIVLGIEADYIRYNIAFEKVPAIKAVDGRSLRARAGYVFKNAMFYGTAGVAYGTTNVNLEDYGGIVGAGIDYKLTDNLIFGVEYTHTWFRDFDNANIDANFDIVRARLLYRFP